MKYLIVFFILYSTLISCENAKQKKLLSEIIHLINSPHQNIQPIDNCHCTLMEKDGEVVSSIVKKIDFKELDKITIFIRDSTFVSAYHFHNGVGIEISELTPLPNKKVTKKLYEELESYNDGFGLSHKNKEELKTVVNNIKKIANNCGASVVTQN